MNLRKGLASRRQGNRAMRNRQLPDCREHGLQGRISPVEAPAKAFYYIGEMTTTTQLGSPSISAIVCSCPTGARIHKQRVLRKRRLCRRENTTSFPSLKRKTRRSYLLSCGFASLRLTIQPLLARKKIEASSLRSRLPRERRRRMLPLAKCTSVEFRNASRSQISSIRTIQALESSVRKAKSSRRSLAGSPSPK